LLIEARVISVSLAKGANGDYFAINTTCLVLRPRFLDHVRTLCPQHFGPASFAIVRQQFN
jgi:hypothetical protein